MPDRILIIGGYGKAGRNIAQLLLEHSSYELTLAGRTRSKAKQTARSLDPERCQGLQLDLTNTENLGRVLSDHDLVTLCLSYPDDKRKIIQTIVNAGIHYIDITPNADKNKLLRSRQDLIEDHKTCCILEAGWEPGLPAFLVRWLAQEQNLEPDRVSIQGFYRDRSMPYSSCADILDHAELSTQTFTKGVWQTASILSSEKATFPPPFGSERLYPTDLEELHALTQQRSMKELSYHHSGYGWICDAILFVWMLLGLRRFTLTRDWGIRLFQWIYQHTASPPFGGAIKVITYEDQHDYTASMLTDNLYRSTAIPVVATIKQILEYDSISTGVHFMGMAVEPSTFAQEISEMGLEIADT